MANVRIDNYSGDTVTVILDGVPRTVEDDGRVTFDSLQKGQHTLRVHRTRIPLETADNYDEQEISFSQVIEGKDKTLHTHLDLIAEFDLNSSKAVITVQSAVTAKEGKGIDAIFSSYSVEYSGAKQQKERKVFSNSAVKKSFVSQNIKNVMFPIGLCGLIIFFLALISLFAALAGKPVDLGGTVFTLPWASGLTTVAAAVCAYTFFCIANIFKTSKSLSK